MNVVILDSVHWQEAEENGFTRTDANSIVTQAAKHTSEILPARFEHTNILIEPAKSEDVIPETGSAGITYDDGHVWITFDYKLPYAITTLRTSIYGMVHHELVHAATFAHDPWRASADFGMVTEGLATVFERDHGNESVAELWGCYKDDSTMSKWYDEIRLLAETTQKDMRYFVNHPDGRKWVVYKTGTWMIDKLIQSGMDLFDLMNLPHKKIIEMFERSR